MRENTNTLVKPITNTLSSIAGYSSTIYIIFLTLSICYNIGYMKQINPQIIDLIELSDYVNDTAHNVWFFLLGALVFFIGSLTITKVNVENQFNKVLLFGITTFIISLYFLLKGAYDSNEEPSLLIALYIGIMIAGIISTYYFITTRVKINQKKHAILTSMAPILIFLILVLMPYIGGMSQGYIENKYLTKENYQTTHSVDLILVPGDEVLKDIYIIKKLNKGLIIRQFHYTEKTDTFRFINWANIKAITYKRVEELLSPI